jgi:hypothetical protein
MTFALCFGLAEEREADGHVDVGAIFRRLPMCGWLANRAHDLRRREPSDLGWRVLTSIAAAYDADLRDQRGLRIAKGETSRDIVVRPGDEKPLRLPSHRWLALDGLKAQPKPQCVGSAGTENVAWQHDHEPPKDEYFTTTFGEDDCAEKRLCLECAIGRRGCGDCWERW